MPATEVSVVIRAPVNIRDPPADRPFVDRGTMFAYQFHGHLVPYLWDDDKVTEVGVGRI